MSQLFVVVTNPKTGVRKGSLDKAKVYFHEIPDGIIKKLIDAGVVFNVAGGLLLEHPLTQTFVVRVEGDCDSIMGLPKELTEKLIREVISLQCIVNDKLSNQAHI